jgi:hypothetical protein
MINFQDVLKQKGDTYGGVWADERVYHIAKEIQLMKPDQFSNIFLGLGGFHMEKNVDSPQLTQSVMQMAEIFLIKCLKPSSLRKPQVMQ